MTQPEVKTPMGGVPIIPVIMMTMGGYLAWFGIHYWRSNVKWPTDPIKAILTGKALPSNAIDDSAEVNSFGYLIGNNSTTQGPTQTGPVPPPIVAGNYDHNSLEQLWVSAAGDPKQSNLAAAIAQAESSGNPNSTSSNPDGGTNVGLWQLDTKGVGAGHTVDQLKNPMLNAQITVLGSSNGTRWSPWETYNTGAYKKYLA